MNLKPKKELSEAEIQKGLKLVIGDGLTSEVMTVFTGGAFLVALALLLNANNFQIGLLAALPTLTHIFQLISIWLVRKYNNRRAIVVFCSLGARIPLLAIGTLLLLFSFAVTIETLIILLIFFYLFGSIAGPSWNAWMKDLVPERSLGAYFSRRSRLNQMLNVALSLLTALVLDYFKKQHPEKQLYAYAVLFTLAGIVGISGAVILSRTPEPEGVPLKEDFFELLKKPLKDRNFRSLLIFNSTWVFAINIGTPFFTVFLLKQMGLSLSYIILLGIVSQISSILTLRLWGTYADRYSNKTIIALCAPLYIGCFIAWCFVGLYAHRYVNIILLILIYLFTGISTAGINLSLTNIGLKLAPRAEAVVYLSAKNIVTALFSSVAPLIGGILADYFSNRHLNLDIEWSGPRLTRAVHLFHLEGWNFLFLIAAALALLALELLVQVKETGEVNKDDVRRILRKNLRGTFREYFLIGQLIGWRDHVWEKIRKKWVS